MRYLLLLVFSQWFCSITYGTHDTETVIVNTSEGRIKGLSVPVIGHEQNKVYQFRKIPYASPPVGNLRFAKPTPHPTWSGILDATEFGPSCMQIIDEFASYLLPNKNVSEDCLFLNIYVPTNVTTATKRHVMVWIHGGAYVNGAGMMYDGSYLAITGDVIVVTINYRLGIYGFFTTGTTEAKGNYGLWDQILALEWVHNNIASFGGDPNSVTIFGESAGGFSVGLQALIPANKGRFHRVIAESGVANSPLALAPFGSKMTHIVGSIAMCKQDISSSEFLTCMRHLTSNAILAATVAAIISEPPDAIHYALWFGPVIDSELFSDYPSNILKDHSSEAMKFFKSLDIIVGNCNDEGSLVLISTSPAIQRQFHFNLTVGIPYDIFKTDIVKTLTDDYFSSNLKVATAICGEYCVQNNISEQSRQALDMYTDFFFVSPAVNTLHLHSFENTDSKRYQYIFSRRSQVPYGPPRPAWYRGSGHASELIYLFGIDLLPVRKNVTVPQADYALSRQMLRYWTNFAKSGDPNGGDNLPTWPQFEDPLRSYLQLDAQIAAKSKYNDDKMEFWLVEIPKLLPPQELLQSPNNGADNVKYAFYLSFTAMFVSKIFVVV